MTDYPKKDRPLIKAKTVKGIAGVEKGPKRSVLYSLIDHILPLAQSTVSQHLKHLKAAGLIQGEVEGLKTCYCLDHDVLRRFKRMVATI